MHGTFEEIEELDLLPPLTVQQEKFVRGILDGMSASDAYRSAYDCSNSVDSTIWCNASQLRSSAKVSQWLKAAKKAGLDRAALTVESHLAELERLKEIALDAGNATAAITAEQLRGKVMGLYIDQVRDVTRSPAEIIAEIVGLLPSLSDDARDAVQKKLGHTEHIGEQHHGAGKADNEAGE